MTKLEDKNTREYRLYHNITTPEQEMQRLEAIIRNLKRERDEARRRICEMLHEEGYGRSPKEWAKRKGWDCFKENTNG